MPVNPEQRSIPGWIKELLERMRMVERIHQDVQEFVDNDTRLSAYSWQSAFSLVTGFGHKLFADRDGVVAFVRAERSSGDGTSEASMDVLLDGVTLFPGGAFPTVPIGTMLGPEIPFTTVRAKQQIRFLKGQEFQVNVLATGGGTGPLRVTIHYIPEQTKTREVASPSTSI